MAFAFNAPETKLDFAPKALEIKPDFAPKALEAKLDLALRALVTLAIVFEDLAEVPVELDEPLVLLLPAAPAEPEAPAEPDDTELPFEKLFLAKLSPANLLESLLLASDFMLDTDLLFELLKLLLLAVVLLPDALLEEEPTLLLAERLLPVSN